MIVERDEEEKIETVFDVADVGKKERERRIINFNKNLQVGMYKTKIKTIVDATRWGYDRVLTLRDLIQGGNDMSHLNKYEAILLSAVFGKTLEQMFEDPNPERKENEV